jgi:hypothetical protein
VKGVTHHPGFEHVAKREVGIHIKPSHKGLLHEDLGIPQGQPIPRAKEEAAKHSSNPAVRKRANFALNFGKKK